MAARGRSIELAGLPALSIRPRGARALMTLAHGAGAGMRHAFMEALAQGLADHGIATLRWEFPFMATGSRRPDRPEVAEAAVRAVWTASRRLARGLPRFAAGKSFGGRMTSRAHAATPLDELRGIAFVGFPLHPPDKPGIERAEHLAQAAGPLLFVSGTRDELAQLRLLRPVVRSLGRRATLHVLEGADHGFSLKPAMIDGISSTIRQWVDRILDSA